MAKRMTDAERAHKADEDKRKNKALMDYEQLLNKVGSLQDMTSTEAWRSVFTFAKRMQADHKNALVTCATKDLAGHQAAVKFVDMFMAKVGEPVTDLASFMREMPLFAKSFHTTAEWSTELGTVTTRRA